MKRKTFHSIIHNPGYDFIRELSFLNDEIKKGNPPKTSIYFGPVLGVLFACFGIEGYINFVGKRVDPQWKTKILRFEPIKSKIIRLFEIKNKTINFQEGIFKDTIDLFAWRKDLVHPEYLRENKRQKSKIPDIFDKTLKTFPVQKSLKIAIEFRETVLKEFKIEDRWRTEGKNIPTEIIEMDD